MTKPRKPPATRPPARMPKKQRTARRRSDAAWAAVLALGGWVLYWANLSPAGVVLAGLAGLGMLGLGLRWVAR